MPPDAGPSLADVLRGILRHPVRSLVWRWNYKSALTSAIVRGALFFATNLPAGWDAAVGALATEFVLRLGLSGFYGAMTQALRHVRPTRHGTVAGLVILPLLAHGVEGVVHWWRATPALALSVALSVALTGVSTSFNLFAMRRGVLVVGVRDGRSLGADLLALPGLLAGFVLAIVRALLAVRLHRPPLSGAPR